MYKTDICYSAEPFYLDLWYLLHSETLDMMILILQMENISVVVTFESQSHALKLACWRQTAGSPYLTNYLFSIYPTGKEIIPYIYPSDFQPLCSPTAQDHLDSAGVLSHI